MKKLTKQEICDVLINAGNYLRTVYSLYDVAIVDFTKYKNSLSISVHYTTDIVSYKELYSLFRDYMSKYKAFICSDDCFDSDNISSRAAHFELRFFA